VCDIGLPTQASHELKAVDRWHEHIGDHQVGRPHARQTERFVSAIRLKHTMTGVAQQRREKFAVRRTVVNY
jgi:hypothetical protein